MSLRYIFCIFAYFLLARVDQLRAEDKSKTCHNSHIAVDLWVKEGLAVSNDDVYKDFRAVAGTSCQLEETCCSHKLEGALHDFTATQYSSKIKKSIVDILTPCRKKSVIDDTVEFFQSFKRLIVMHLNRVYGAYFRGHENILDDLFEKLELAIKTGETKDINDIYSKTFFEMYTAAFITHPGTRGFLNSDKARSCFHSYYVNTERSRVDHWRTLFRESFDSLMYYLRGLQASENLIEKVFTHAISKQCKFSLVKMDRCSACAGYTSLRSCKGLCMNLLRGCLVDLSDLEGPLMELAQALEDTNAHFIPLQRNIKSLEQNVFQLIGDTSFNAITIKTRVSACLIRSKRSVEETNGEVRVKRMSDVLPRSQIDFPSEIFNETAQCLKGKISSLMAIPEFICGASASRENKNCWNGHLYDSYSRDVVEFKRVSQKDNPEVLYCPFPSQFQYEINVIKYVVRELASLVDKCGSDDEDCSNFATPTNFYSFPPATNFKSSVDVVAVDDEEGAMDAGSGSGSGEESNLVCEREVPTNAVITEVSATEDKVIKQEESGSATHRWSYSITMVTVLLTFIFTAFL